jgi:hypothetical protein
MRWGVEQLAAGLLAVSIQRTSLATALRCPTRMSGRSWCDNPQALLGKFVIHL